jgi:hypothetical protein
MRTLHDARRHSVTFLCPAGRVQQAAGHNAETDQMDEDGLEDLRRDYQTRPKQVY